MKKNHLFCLRNPECEHGVMVENCGLWPNLKKLPDGNPGVFCYDRPSHGYGCGNISLWVGDKTCAGWKFRSTVSDHEESPDCVRMNHAAGVSRDSLVHVIVSGYSKNRAAPLLPLQCCTSQDSGMTWKRELLPLDKELVPFGDISEDEQGFLHFGCHRNTGGKIDAFEVVMDSASRNFQILPISPDSGEVSLLQTGSGIWYAVARDTSDRGRNYRNSAAASDFLILLRREKNLKTWEKICNLTIPGQIPRHLLEMPDGSLLLTYGSRITGLSGVQAMRGSPDGKTWTPCVTLAACEGPSDCGYPSSILMEDGRIVTAYYAGGDPDNRPELYNFPDRTCYHAAWCAYAGSLFEDWKLRR